MNLDGFVNRKLELAALDAWWGRGDLFGLVWGRRRVGKSWLIGKFALDKRAVVHVGGDRTRGQELALLSDAVLRAGLAGSRDLSSRPYASWDEALDGLLAAAGQAGEPVLLVLDEFPELLRSEPSLESALRAFGERAPGGGPLRVLLCGSAVRVMERVQEERSPLYGRFGLALQVHPFRPHEAAMMLPDLEPPDRALVWGLLGGIPLYLSWWDQRLSVSDNLAALVCQPGARLLTEGRLVLATEADTQLGGPVLSAIANGRTKFSEIRDAVRSDPTRTLERLIELRLIERNHPVTEPDHSRHSRYLVADNFLAFWLGIVDRYRSEISRGLGDSILPVMIESLDDFMGQRWEEAFRSHLRRLASDGVVGPGVVAIGSFWKGGGEEIDAVALAGRGREAVLLGEAKWRATVDAPPLEAALHRKAAALPKVADDLRTAICAREQVRRASSSTLAITAHDIFGVGEDG
jgi:uncharacterized protein